MALAANNPSLVKEMLMAEAHDIGHGQVRDRLEDRSKCEKVKTQAGLELYVGVVADGVGGASAGETASQTTLDTVFEEIAASTGQDVHTILEAALLKAHQVVRELAATSPSLRTMSTTCSVAAVHEGRLYLAHVGDSRVYLVRGDQIRQLTLDHTWSNEMVRQNRFSPQEVVNHPKRDELARYIGQPVPFEVDAGIRLLENLEPGMHPAKTTLSREPLTLLPGDVVVVCSDGLIKERHKASGHYVEASEIVREAHRKSGQPQDTANTLVSLALGRRTDDNVSVVILEAPGARQGLPAPLMRMPMPAGLAVPKLNPKLLAFGGSGIVLLFLLALGGLSIFSSRKAAAPPTSMPTSTVVAATPTPAVYAVVERTVLAPGQINAGGQEISAAQGVQILPGAETSVATTSGSLKLSLTDGTLLYLGPNTRIYLTGIAGPGSSTADTLIRLEEGMLLVVSQKISVTTSREFAANVRADAGARAGVMGIRYISAEARFVVDCLKGECGSNLTSLNAGGQGKVEGGAVIPGEAQYGEWQALEAALGGMDIPAPTAAPSATFEPTPTETPEMTPTVVKKPC